MTPTGIIFRCALIALGYALATSLAEAFHNRHMKVHVFKDELVDKLVALSEKDKKDGKPWKWRAEKMIAVSETEMILKFWKPLKVENFYKDTKFLE